MKKLIALLCVFAMLVLAACNNLDNTQNSTTTKPANDNNETKKSEIVTNAVTDIGSVTTQVSKNKDEVTTKSELVTVPQDETGKDVPYILRETLVKLKAIKSATETVSESDFSEYMYNNFNDEEFNGMDTFDNTVRLLGDFERTYVIYIDDFAEDNLLSYYIDSGFIYYRISADEEFYLCCRSFAKPDNAYEYKEIEFMKYLKSYEINGMTIELFENTSDETNGLYGNIKINGVCIPFFTNISVSVEQFESIVPRICFATIGDLMNE